jgi:hypothetical protein
MGIKLRVPYNTGNFSTEEILNSQRLLHGVSWFKHHHQERFFVTPQENYTKLNHVTQRLLGFVANILEFK